MANVFESWFMAECVVQSYSIFAASVLESMHSISQACHINVMPEVCFAVGTSQSQL